MSLLCVGEILLPAGYASENRLGPAPVVAVSSARAPRGRDVLKGPTRTRPVCTTSGLARRLARLRIGNGYALLILWIRRDDIFSRRSELRAPPRSCPLAHSSPSRRPP